jgi:hypothetical protein
MSIQDFLGRLRTGSFISPETTTVQEFLTDTLQKKGGKKVATAEIIDSNESVSQDFGNITDTFSIAMYFTGEDFDTQLTDFEKLLKEHYTQDSPGYLRHPLWGDITVFPTSWDLSIELISGVGVGKLQVEFIEVFPKKYPDSALDSSSIASASLDDMSALDMASRIITDTVAAAKNIKDKIEGVVNVINAATEVIETIEDTATALQNEINGLIDDVAGGIAGLLFATQRLMRLPARIVDSTMNKINVYSDMISDIINSISGKDGKGIPATLETNADNRMNNAVMMEVFAGYAVACLAEAALYTDFSVRTSSIQAIEKINDAIELYNTELAEIRSEGVDIRREYSGDYNYQSLMNEAAARVNEILLNKSFDLKAEKKFTLKTQSDILNLCYENYGKIDQETIDYFCSTNKIVNDEFFELQSGMEIVIYV